MLLRPLLYFLILALSLIFDQKLSGLSNLGLRNPNFIGREEQLKKINNYFKAKNYVVLSGISGVGKTQIAKEFAYINGSNYSQIYWITADSGIELQLNDFIKTYSREASFSHINWYRQVVWEDRI